MDGLLLDVSRSPGVMDSLLLDDPSAYTKIRLRIINHFALHCSFDVVVISMISKTLGIIT